MSSSAVAASKPKKTETPQPTPVATQIVPVAEPTKIQEEPRQRLALGLGYPDVRVRYALMKTWAIEGKFAFADGIQVYTLRTYWNYWDLGPFKLTAGAEGGMASFNNIETISGTGYLGAGFLGIEYPFAKRLRLSVDVGPAWLEASSEDQTYSSTELIFNTALYIFIF